MAGVVYLFAGRQVRQSLRLPCMELRAASGQWSAAGTRAASEDRGESRGEERLQQQYAHIHLDMEADHVSVATAFTSDGQPNGRQ
jgi:hypothetical protein